MKPTPISEKEVQNILHQIQEGVEKPKPKVLFEVGELVRVKDGPFTDFQGSVEDVNYEKSRHTHAGWTAEPFDHFITEREKERCEKR